MFRSYTEQWVDSCGMFKDAIIGLLAATPVQAFLALFLQSSPPRILTRQLGGAGISILSTLSELFLRD
jgi:hypothetical protein